MIKRTVPFLLFVAVSVIIAVNAFFVGMLFCCMEERGCYAVNLPYAVIGDDVWMLGENGEKLFLLPESYYAKIDRMDDNYYYITFNGVSGKIPKGSVSVIGYDKQVADTQKIIRIKQEYTVFTEIKLKGSLEGENAEIITVPTGEPLTYIGTYKQGDAIWYYVSYGGKYGYLLNTYTDTPEIKQERFVSETEPVDDAPLPKQAEEKENDVVKIVIIGGVSFVVLVVIVILFLPRKNKKHKYYYS